MVATLRGLAARRPPAPAVVTDFELNEQDEVVQSEHEYEYDDNETEHFFFTLDLTTHVPPLVPRRPGNRNLKRKRASAAQHGYGAAQGTNGNTEPDQTSSDREATEDVGTPRDGGTPQKEFPMELPGKLQVIDLHTKNPLVAYKNEFFSCYWATDLGTQMFLAGKGAVEEPLRSFRKFDLVGTSGARLVGKPVKLQLRDKEGEQANPIDLDSADTTFASAPLPPPVMPAASNGTPTPSTAPVPLKLNLPPTADAATLAQASFLERLSAIKVAKGEYDPVPTTPVRNSAKYVKGPGWKRRNLEEERQSSEHTNTSTPRAWDEVRQAGRQAASTPIRGGAGATSVRFTAETEAGDAGIEEPRWNTEAEPW